MSLEHWGLEWPPTSEGEGTEIAAETRTSENVYKSYYYIAADPENLRLMRFFSYSVRPLRDGGLVLIEWRKNRGAASDENINDAEININDNDKEKEMKVIFI